MRLIDADKLEDVATKANEQGLDITRYEFKRIELVINEFPTVEAEPVRHGHWFFQEYVDGYYCTECSECGEWFDPDVEKKGWKYCPKCGAKMEEPMFRKLRMVEPIDKAVVLKKENTDGEVTE